jgi:hypothetical protein
VSGRHGLPKNDREVRTLKILLTKPSFRRPNLRAELSKDKQPVIECP